MKPNPNLDELLSSFMDGELSPRQRTEVQRMAAHDPSVARRLRQLQNCRTLFCSLPPAEAPGDLLEQIKHTLERKTLLQEHPVSSRRTAGVVHLVFRKLVAAAAMIALLATLGVVVYQVVAPVPGSGPFVATAPNPLPPAVEDLGGAAPALAMADAGFSGRLELRTAAFGSTDTFVRREIQTCGLTNLSETGTADDQRVYRVAGTRDSVNRLIASLGGVWQDFDSAALSVESPDGRATPVTIESVTPEQIVAVVDRNSTEASIETAATYAVMNRVMRNAPGGDLPPIADDSGGLWAMDAIPMPKLTGPERPNNATHTPVQGSAQASLTIVLLRTTR
ncbi:MAG: hypothetical protein KBE65_13070 [Phycisphaerae bacterium]|nr:hypothetical protein [Phycisphaerae bacterium]